MDSVECRAETKTKTTLETFEVIRFKADVKIKGYEMSSALLNSLLKVPADVFHAHGYSMFSTDAAAVTAKIRKIPFILTSHGSWQAAYPLSRLMLKFYDPIVWRIETLMASKCIALTDYQANIFLKMGVHRNRIELVPNGINLDDYSLPLPKEDIIQEYNLKGKLITFIGRLTEKKASALVPLLKAFKELKPDFPETKIVIVGPDSNKDNYLLKLKHLVYSLGLTESVVFTGKIVGQRKIMLISASSIGLILSTQEAFPLTCLEFMALAKPVIASRVGGIPYIIEDGYNGLLIDNDQFSIQISLRKLLSDPSFANKLGNNGRQSVLSKYNWKSVVDKLERIYIHAASDKC
jgi:glycosyltransferase involved in cell wall biosynthesis